MNQWHFVIGAYVISLPVLTWLVMSSLAVMRRAEKAADEFRRGDR